MKTKILVISMQYGFVGCISHPKGFSNVAHHHSRSNQFVLDPHANYSDQLFSALQSMTLEAGIYHDSEARVDVGMGYILSHSVTVIDCE